MILPTNLSTSVCSGSAFLVSAVESSLASKAEAGLLPNPANVLRLLGSLASLLTFCLLLGNSKSPSTGDPALVGLVCPDPGTKTEANLPLGLLGLLRPKWIVSAQRDDPLGEGVRSSPRSEAADEKLGILTGPGRRLGERVFLAGESGRRWWGSAPAAALISEKRDT
jgi:hypothetical protein